MPSGAKKRRAAKKKQEIGEPIKSFTSSEGLSHDSGSSAIDDANVSVAKDTSVVDLAKDVAAMELKADEGKMLPPIDENILDESQSVLNTPVAVELAKPVDTMPKEVSNMEDYNTEDLKEDSIEHLLPSPDMNVLEEPNTETVTLALGDMPKPDETLANEVIDVYKVIEDVANLPKPEETLANEVIDVYKVIEDVANLRKPEETLANEVIDVYKVIEDVANLPKPEETLANEVIDVYKVIEDVANLRKPEETLANEVIDVYKVIEDVANLRKPEETLANEVIDVYKVIEDVANLPKPDFALSHELIADYKVIENVGDLPKPDPTLSNEVIDDYKVVEDVDVDNLIKNDDNSLVEPNSVINEPVVADLDFEPASASEHIPPDQCPLHCTYYEWMSKELSKACTGGEVNKNMSCAERLDGIRKLVDAELQVVDKTRMFLRDLLNDLNSIKLTEGEGVSTEEV